MTKPLQPRPRSGQRAVFLLAVFAPLAAHAAGQTASACPATRPAGPEIHVQVAGAKNTAGNITFTLYGEDRQRFLAHHGSIAIQRVMLTAPAAEACFAVSSPGIYAVAVYHDANNNHHLDRTLLGLPAEGYGFSNNVKPALGLPAFDSVKFDVGADDAHLNISLIY